MLIVAGGFGILVSLIGYRALFIGLGAVISVAGILGIFIIKDSPVIKKSGSFGDIFYGFRPSVVKSNKSLYATLLIVVVYGIACQIFMPYLIIYYEYSLEMKNYVLIMAPAIILASVATALWGRVYDKKGFKLTGVIALISLCAGFIILYFFRSTVPVFIGSLVMMCGYLAGMAVFGARIRALIPENMAGRLQGVRIIGQVLIPGVIGPAVGAWVLRNAQQILNSDGTYSFLPNENIFLAAAVAAVAVVMVLGVYFRCQLKPEKKVTYGKMPQRRRYKK